MTFAGFNLSGRNIPMAKFRFMCDWLKGVCEGGFDERNSRIEVKKFLLYLKLQEQTNRLVDKTEDHEYVCKVIDFFITDGFEKCLRLVLDMYEDEVEKKVINENEYIKKMHECKVIHNVLDIKDIVPEGMKFYDVIQKTEEDMCLLFVDNDFDEEVCTKKSIREMVAQTP